ncbi:MAG TPA: hypothetical protein VM287_10040 [Egibacteraceae bacterium]|nr:hypothetical protein [Egibacteraceae bacterium]
MSEQASDERPSTGEGAKSDTSLRNFVIGLLAVSAVVIVLMYLLQTAAS